MLNVLIIGATSAIAEATARRYAARGARLFLVARDATRLADIAADLRTRGAVAVGEVTLDINHIDAHAEVLDRAWAMLESVDVILIAHGTLPDQHACEQSVETTLAEFATNATSTIAMLTAMGMRMEPTHQGTIAVISSVAGDRGRASNYVYGAAKAAVSTFLSGLRQRLTSAGVNVLTIKPGFVDTPMTATFKKGLLWASADTVATGITRAIDRRKGIVYVPGFWWLIMFVIRSVPEIAFRRVKL